MLLLEVTLGKVLQLTLGKLNISGDGDGELGGVTGDNNVVLGEVSGLSLDLDALLEVLLEGGNVQNLILNGCTAVDDELDSSLLSSLSLCLGNKEMDKGVQIKLVRLIQASYSVQLDSNHKSKGPD